MLHITTETRKSIDLEDLTDDQWADIDRLLMIVWKTKYVTRQVRLDVYTDMRYSDECEASHDN
jgi:uncharacterized linocin/CFP29 family protein